MTTRGPGIAEDAALAAIVRSSQDAVIGKDVGGLITAWNDGATRIYGFSAEEMLGCSFEVMVPGEYLAEERERHTKVAAGAAESGYRCVRLHADGRALEVVMSMSPVLDETGAVVGVATISRLVSGRERADALFASLLEAAPDAMLCVAADGLITFANSRAQDVFGYSPAELVGVAVETLLPAELAATHPQYRDQFFRSPKPRAMGVGQPLRARRRDGTTFPVEVSLGADTSGETPLAIVAARDVTDLRATEASLRESETRLRQLADHVDTVFTLRQINPPALLYVSPAFERLTGIDPMPLKDAPQGYVELIHPEDRERVRNQYVALIDAGEPAQIEYRILRVDGEVRWLRASAAPVPNPFGPVERVVTAAEDITDRVRADAAIRSAEASARAANEAKNQFLSRMSHELRTPLNAVLGFGQLLEHHLQGTDRVDYAHQIVRAGDHLLELINEVLDITRIEAGQMSVSREPVPIDVLVDETTRLMTPVADASSIELVVTGGPADAYALADRQRLRQILLNLMSNAIKYGVTGGHVWVSWQADADKVTLTVRDDGRGIPPSMAERLFTPFDRLGLEATSIQGTGVGLAVSRSLAELMRGSLHLAPTAAGSGACFELSLPVAHDPSDELATEYDGLTHTTATAPGSARHTLLYIEDNEPNVRVMESFLELRPEWQLVHAGLGGLGVALAQAHRPDLVLLDVHLPDGSGLDVIDALKSAPSTAAVPVVVVSADAGNHQVRRLLDAGAERYLTKPLHLHDVLTMLDAHASESSPEGGTP